MSSTTKKATGDLARKCDECGTARRDGVILHPTYCSHAPLRVRLELNALRIPDLTDPSKLPSRTIFLMFPGVESLDVATFDAAMKAAEEAIRAVILKGGA